MANNKVLAIVTIIVELAFLAIFIACTIYLFKVNQNAKDEPTNRGGYIMYDPYDYYTDGDFCIDHLDPYVSKGAFKEFDLHIKKIKKLSTIIIIILFVTMVLSLFASILGQCCKSKKCSCLMLILLFLSLVGEVLFLVFFIIISVYYFKSKFNKFDDFSECKYLGSSFEKDYDFVYDLKKYFKIFFILGLISFVLNLTQICLNRQLKKAKE